MSIEPKKVHPVVARLRSHDQSLKDIATQLDSLRTSDFDKLCQINELNSKVESIVRMIHKLHQMIKQTGEFVADIRIDQEEVDEFDIPTRRGSVNVDEPGNEEDFFDGPTGIDEGDAECLDLSGPDEPDPSEYVTDEDLIEKPKPIPPKKPNPPKRTAR